MRYLPEKSILVYGLLLFLGQPAFANDSVMTVPSTKNIETPKVPIGSVHAWPVGSKKQLEKDGKGNPVWLECNGSTFDAVKYPELAATLGGNTLPDYSNDFLMGYGASGATQGYVSDELGKKQEASKARHSHTIYRGPIVGSDPSENKLNKMSGTVHVAKNVKTKDYVKISTYDPSGLVQDDRTYSGTDMMDRKIGAVWDMYSSLLNSALCTPSKTNGQCLCVCQADNVSADDPYVMSGPCTKSVALVPAYTDEEGVAHPKETVTQPLGYTDVTTLKVIGKGTWVANSSPAQNATITISPVDITTYHTSAGDPLYIDYSKGISWWYAFAIKNSTTVLEDSISTGTAKSFANVGTFLGNSDGSAVVTFDSAAIQALAKGESLAFTGKFDYTMDSGSSDEGDFTVTLYKYEDGANGGYYVTY